MPKPQIHPRKRKPKFSLSSAAHFNNGHSISSSFSVNPPKGMASRSKKLRYNSAIEKLQKSRSINTCSTTANQAVIETSLPAANDRLELPSHIPSATKQRLSNNMFQIASQIDESSLGTTRSFTVQPCIQTQDSFRIPSRSKPEPFVTDQSLEIFTTSSAESADLIAQLGHACEEFYSFDDKNEIDKKRNFDYFLFPRLEDSLQYQLSLPLPRRPRY